MNMPPDITWLIDELAKWGRRADPSLLEEHAGQILSAVRDIQRQGVILVKKGGRRRQRPRRVIGPKDELQCLRAAAIRAIANPDSKPTWAETWAETAEGTLKLLQWDARSAVAAHRILGFQHENYRRGLILPFPGDALPLIVGALKDLRLTSGSHRRERRGNVLDNELSRVIAEALIAVVGAEGSSKRGQLVTLQRLALSVDTHFDLRIYKPDGRKVRALRAIYKSSAR